MSTVAARRTALRCIAPSARDTTQWCSSSSDREPTSRCSTREDSHHCQKHTTRRRQQRDRYNEAAQHDKRGASEAPRVGSLTARPLARLLCVCLCLVSHWAALFGLKETAEILCEAKADVNSQTKNGETPLHMAAEKGKIEMVKYLLSQGAKTDIRDKGPNGGATAYDTASKAQQKEVMVLLKPAGEGGGCCVVQ